MPDSRGDATTFRAGGAVRDIAVRPGLPMAGYGARAGAARGTSQPLQVRTAVFGDESGPVAGLAVCDLVSVPAGLTAAVRTAVGGTLGLPPEAVLVAATHTHSGPAVPASPDDPDFGRLAGDVAGTFDEAARGMTAVSAKIIAGTVDSVAASRRDPPGPVDPRLRVISFEGPEGIPVLSLVAYACHATVLDHRNLLFSPDFPGPLVREVERSAGGTCLFLQGACADVNPAWLASSEQEAERIGRLLGAAAARLSHEVRACGVPRWTLNLSLGEDYVGRKVAVPWKGGRVLRAGPVAVRRLSVRLPRRILPGPDRIARELEEISRRRAGSAAGGTDEARLLARRNELLMMRGPHAGRLYAEDGATEDAEVQVMRLAGDCFLVSLPGEFFVETALDIARSCAPAEVIVICYANDYLGYVPAAGAFSAGGYEVGCARFAPPSAGLLVEAISAAVRSLAGGLHDSPA